MNGGYHLISGSEVTSELIDKCVRIFPVSMGSTLESEADRIIKIQSAVPCVVRFIYFYM